MDFFLVKVLTVFVLIFFANIDINEGYNTTCLPPPICCKSYYSDQSNHSVCTGCLPGFHGSDCKYTCRYPNYGEDCQSECLCDEETCDHIKGCKQKTCPKGYSGSSCNSTCQFPSYGTDCKLNCSCEEHQCDFITGCKTSDPNESYWTTDINIMYVLYDHKNKNNGLLNDKSAWSKMNTSHKAMLVSICIIGTIFFIFLVIIIILNKKKNVVISYYH